jgi:RHS repeat-associated protein
MWTWNSDPFGTDAANANPSGTGMFAFSLRFPGQLFDGEAGLHQNRFRDYDPATANYVESDPLGLGGGNLSTYAYAASDPLSSLDPDGLASRGRAIPALPQLLPPAIVIPGTPENSSWVHNATDALSLPSSPIPNTQSSAQAKNCPNPDECKQLNEQVQAAKNRVGTLGACRAGMTIEQLSERYDAWLDLASARAKRDQKCWGGGDQGHQQAQADAWSHVGACSRLINPAAF